MLEVHELLDVHLLYTYLVCMNTEQSKRHNERSRVEPVSIIDPGVFMYFHILISKEEATC